MIAKKRKLDPELLSMASTLHDPHAYNTGSYEEHAHKGTELAREILNELRRKLFVLLSTTMMINWPLTAQLMKL